MYNRQLSMLVRTSFGPISVLRPFSWAAPARRAARGHRAFAATGTSSVRGDTSLTVTGSAGNYDLSVDGGLSTVNTDGTNANLAVTHSTTGEILYVDTTQISDTGVDLVRAPGTYDIFSTLIGIRDILSNENNFSDAQVREMLDSSLDSLDEISGLLVGAEVSIGSKIGFLDDLYDNIQNVEFYAKDETTRLPVPP